MNELEYLKQTENILAMSYWENFSFLKTITQSHGAGSKRVQELTANCNSMQAEWNSISLKIKELESISAPIESK